MNYMSNNYKKFIRKHKKEIQAFLLIGFPLIWWSVFFLIAFCSSFYYSFTDLRFDPSKITSFTFDNYARLFGFMGKELDTEFWSSLKVTVIWTVVMLIGNNVSGLLLAFLIKSLKRGKKFFLALLFWPSLVSAVVGSDIAKMIFSSESTGLANVVIGWFGAEPIQWFSDESWALFALMVTPFFLGFCIKLLIYYSSIISIPDSYIESATLETSSKFKVFFTITLPLMKNAIVLNIMLSIIDGFKVLGPMQLITDGAYKTQSVVLYIYNLAFQKQQMGRACAYSFVLFIIILAFSLLQLKISGKEADTFE